MSADCVGGAATMTCKSRGGSPECIGVVRKLDVERVLAGLLVTSYGEIRAVGAN